MHDRRRFDQFVLGHLGVSLLWSAGLLPPLLFWLGSWLGASALSSQKAG